MSENQATYPIATMCRLLGVSSSGYYAWAKRTPSQRAQADAVVLSHIRAAHAASHGTYGAPRIHVELRENGIRVGRKRVARLMADAGLMGVSRRRFVTTTVRGGGRQAPDLVERKFAADHPDRLWVADITYIPTAAGFLYLAVVLDACSRRIVGWAMGTKLVTQLVLGALEMALATRRPNGAAGWWFAAAWLSRSPSTWDSISRVAKLQAIYNGIAATCAGFAALLQLVVTGFMPVCRAFG